MSAKPIRVAVVGAGEFGRNHVRVWSESEGAELIGIVDTDADRARQVGAEFGTQVLPDIDSLAAQNIDAVSLAVPTKDHARVGCRLLEAGFDVLVEKPVAASLDEADALIASAKRARRILQVGHVERFNPADRRRSADCFAPDVFRSSPPRHLSRRAASMSTSSTTS